MFRPPGFVLDPGRHISERALFLLKTVAEVIDPAMGSVQLNCIECQLCAIKAANVRMKLLLVTYPSVDRFQTRRIGCQTIEKIMGWNYGPGVIFPQNSICLTVCEPCLDWQNENVNIS